MCRTAVILIKKYAIGFFYNFTHNNSNNEKKKPLVRVKILVCLYSLCAMVIIGDFNKDILLIEKK